LAAETRRVLKRGGRLVLMTPIKKEAEEALSMNFALDERLEVLVAGKKAVVFVCRST
jgi:tRNA G10  N-methylase Trm11